MSIKTDRMNYTREIAEEVLKDWNNFFNDSEEFTSTDIKFLDHKFPNPKSGWYKTIEENNEKWLVYFNFEEMLRYGFNGKGLWFENDNNTESFNHKNDYPADPKEVEERMEELLTSMGYIEGVNFKPIDSPFINKCKITTLDFDHFCNEDYEHLENVIYSRGMIVFEAGKFAEIIEQPKEDVHEALKKAKKLVKELEKLLP